MLQYFMTYLNYYLGTFLDNEEGQDLIEYALIIVLIVIAAVVGMALIGPRIAAIWTLILGFLGGAAT